MYPKYPRIIPDRDKHRDWYLDEDVLVLLEDGHSLYIEKGYRFDSHSVPRWARLFFPRYIKTEEGMPNDIYASMVHDYLIDTEPWHRFTRAYIDRQYVQFMHNPYYIITDARAKWMSRAVSLYGYLKYTVWQDYRGEVKPNTHVRVHITHGII